jgi:hypothetical protein
MRAFGKMLTLRKERELPTQWNNGEEVMDWWLNTERRDKPLEGQTEMEFNIMQDGEGID